MIAQPRANPPRWLLPAVFALTVLGIARGLLLLVHEPLLAYANSYDQTRYSACFDLYPDRPADVVPTQNSPGAPYSRYIFVATGDPLCYWSSELLLQGTVVLAYRLDALVTGAQNFPVRWIGGLKFGLLLALSIGFSRVWLRRDRPWHAVANAALLPIVFADPANTLYLATFYAEWTALLAAYLLIGLLLLYADQPRRALRFGLLALAALLLATSKLQHLLLPLGSAVIVLGVGRLIARRWVWQGVALLLGALLGLYVQFVQLQRGGQMMSSIRQFNNADVVLTGILPFASDPARTAAAIGIDASCLAFIGKPAYQLGDLPDRACLGLANFSRGRELAQLAREPDIAARLWWNGVLRLQPWMANNLGHVEGGDFAHLPPRYVSLSDAIGASRALQLSLFLLPLAAWAALLLLRGWRYYPQGFLFTSLVVLIQQATLAITVLGDGLADTAKQGHLVFNVGLAWAIAGAIVLLGTRISAGSQARTQFQAKDRSR